MGHSALPIMWLAPAIIFSANKPQNKRWILPWNDEQYLRCYILDSKRKTKMASGNGINRPNMDLFIMFCIPVSMQRAASRSVTWVIWSGDSSMWTQPTFPSNSNWWTQKTDSKKRDKTPKRRQNMQNVLLSNMATRAACSCFSISTNSVLTYSKNRKQWPLNMNC